MIDFDALVIGPCMATFGEAVLYQPIAGAAFEITGVFDEAYLEQAGIDATIPGSVSNTRPMLGVQLSQFAIEPAQNDVLTIIRTGQTYWVNAVRPDSHGAARLLLNVACPT